MKLKKSLIALLIFGLTLLSPGFTANAAPRATPTLTAGLVSVTGDRLNGATLRADPSGWPSVQITYKYQWFANGVKINRATSSTYTLTGGDFFGQVNEGAAGPTKNITVSVTASASGYKAVTVSSRAATTSSGKVCTQVGSSSSDLFEGTKGLDILCGFEGNDTFLYSKSNDVIDGGDGSDSIDLSMDSRNATVDLTVGTATVKGGSVSSLLSIENVQTGAGADRITGNAQDNRITTFDQDNSTDGADYVSAGDGSDVVISGPGNDTVLGGNGDDVAILGEGDDSFAGGTGTNYCDLADSFDDELVDCISTGAKPDLISVQVPEHGVGDYSITLSDPFKQVSDVQLYFVSGDWPYSLGGVLIANSISLTSTSGTNTVWTANYQLDDSMPDAGDWNLYIRVATFDGRNEVLIGQADGKYGIYETSYESWTGAGAKLGETNNVGPVSVVFNWDTVAPEITSAILANSTLDTSSGTQSVTTHIVATDDGTNHFHVECSLEVFQENLSPTQSDRTSTEFDGAGDCTVQVPGNLPTGSYGISVSVTDSLGNTTVIIPFGDQTYNKFEGKSVSLDNYGDEGASWDLHYDSNINLEFRQTGDGDNESASIASIVWDKPLVATRLSGVAVTAKIVFNGVAGGDIQILCWISNNSGKIQAIEGDATRVIGSPDTYAVSFLVPKKSPKGKYVIGCSFIDSIGWYSSYQGNVDGTFTKYGVNRTNPVADPGSSYFRVG